MSLKERIRARGMTWVMLEKSLAKIRKALGLSRGAKRVAAIKRVLEMPVADLISALPPEAFGCMPALSAKKRKKLSAEQKGEIRNRLRGLHPGSLDYRKVRKDLAKRFGISERQVALCASRSTGRKK